MSRKMSSVEPGKEERRQALLQSMNSMGKAVLVENKYLEKNKLDQIIKTALASTLLHQPSNPFEFLANHFEWENTKSNPAKKACQILMTTDYKLNPSLENSIREAYIIASQCKVREKLKGITGDIYMDMIQMLSCGLTNVEESLLLENIYVPSKEVITFRTFRAGLFCVFVYKEFVAKIRALYVQLERESADGIVSVGVIRKVLEVLRSDEKDGEITEDQEWTSKSKAILAPKGSRSKWRATDNLPTTANEFVQLASDLFWRTMMAHCFSEGV